MSLFGPRSPPIPESDRLWRPFVQFLLGWYWSGTGQRGDREFLDSNIAIQAGGSINIRRSTSIHGLRLSGDYRRVFAEEQGRHQLQFVVSYFLGWRGPEPGGRKLVASDGERPTGRHPVPPLLPKLQRLVPLVAVLVSRPVAEVASGPPSPRRSPCPQSGARPR